MKAGWITPLGQAEIQSEHAVQSLLNSSIDPAPGGATGHVLFSGTVDGLWGIGALFSWPLSTYGIPNNAATVPAINLRFSGSDLCSFFLSRTSPYESALSGHILIQLKQLTHLVTSTFICRKSIHDDLQATAHLPHFVHFSSSNRILSRDIFEISPSSVPTGHTVLQNKRPFAKERIPKSSRKTTGIIYATSLNPLTLICIRL